MTIVDAEIRKQALDCHHSFIVQAPAGSGKTELLTQRFLMLLANVPQVPEEVLAITFTRKAASEMRQRVVESLSRAANELQPEEEPSATNWSIARQVVMRDQAAQWQLLESPNRLRIMTIDAFCSSLIRQMPLLSELGTVPSITEQSERLYQMAAECALAPLQHQVNDEPDPYLQSIETVLVHLDNQVDRLQNLVAMMLARRDQWLTHVMPYYADRDRLREHLQVALALIVEDRLQHHSETLTHFFQKLDHPAIVDELQRLIEFAYHQLKYQITPSELEAHPFARAVNQAEPLLFWQAVAHLLTTRSGANVNWRKARGVTKRLGFINPKTVEHPDERRVAQAAKSELTALLDQLNGAIEYDASAVAGALQALNEVALLPDAGYQTAQWEVIEALIAILVRAVIELKLVFQQEGQVDFSEMGMAAQRALGEEEAPTDLALKLDYQIQHILVDEFQDTSISQFELLRGLTRGWQAGDGRTLFLVGDPMQSIYRFREADVSLFLKARNEGVGPVNLQFLQLQNNFRSYPTIIEWVNDLFSDVLPEQDDLVTGAVAYSPSVAGRSESVEHQVTVAIELFNSDLQQAEQVVNNIVQIRQSRPDERIALLIRARTHAAHLIPLLKEYDVPYQAVEIDALVQKPLIQDLLTLTKAIYYWSDRIAWLALLRAPWCGLSLTDLHALINRGESSAALVWALCQVVEPTDLSETGWLRLQHLNSVMTPLFERRYRYPVREMVESAWIALGGIGYTPKEDLPDAERFFQLLETVDDGWDITDIEGLERAVERLFANPVVEDQNPVQVMTIHKSKGLEFDTVFIPHLEKSGRYDDLALLSWLRQEHPDQEHDLLLFAPIKESYGQEDKINDFIRKLERQKSAYELGRLFYVATTRAKRALYLTATCSLEGDDSDLAESIEATLTSLRKDSLLALLPKQRLQTLLALSDRVAEEHRAQEASLDEEAPKVNADYQCRPDNVVAQWPTALWGKAVSRAAQREGVVCRTETVVAPSVVTRSNDVSEGDVLSWQRVVGTVFHRLIEEAGQCPGFLSEQSDNSGAETERIWTLFLLRAGLPHSKLALALGLLRRAWQGIQQCERARWILGEHRYADNEVDLALYQSAPVEGAIKSDLSTPQIVRYRIDRLFIEAQPHSARNCLWIVDYKLSEPKTGQAVEAFYKQQISCYQKQLMRYGEVAHQLLKTRYPITDVKLGLYFPLFQGWVDWPLAPVYIEQSETIE